MVDSPANQLTSRSVNERISEHRFSSNIYTLFLHNIFIKFIDLIILKIFFLLLYFLSFSLLDILLHSFAQGTQPALRISCKKTDLLVLLTPPPPTPSGIEQNHYESSLIKSGLQEKIYSVQWGGSRFSEGLHIILSFL